ncbi:hypothetical protein CU254_26970 [Amycolatopsis sp. AA4]|uniref:hypothetical protein n=1 Tax=Actinomycetes TaxID=1760 RepID=UPI0001B56617|nr:MULTISPECIES: hypothetical protein [Actinomycetes]ATY16637.1 hypothetical protein CU254_26970 [Amycolatopsis sp. AA4]EFL09643.1 predicted protein [Streptomyces sp. AA4]
MTRPEDPDDRMETHPDLMDPEWRKHAQRDAWLGAKKDLKKRRKHERRNAPSPVYGRGGAAPSRWPGIAAIVGLVLLLAAAVVVHQVQPIGVNDRMIGYGLGSSAETSSQQLF